MSLLILVISLIFIYLLMSVTKTMLKKDGKESVLKKRLLRLLILVRIAPIIAWLILLVLVLAVFQNKTGIRLSHAWLVAQFWAYTAFLYVGFAKTKKVICLISMAISLIIAIYMTPVFHYETVFKGGYIVAADIIATLMFIQLWLLTSKLVSSTKHHKNKVA